MKAVNDAGRAGNAIPRTEIELEAPAVFFLEISSFTGMISVLTWYPRTEKKERLTTGRARAHSESHAYARPSCSFMRKVIEAKSTRYRSGLVVILT